MRKILQLLFCLLPGLSVLSCVYHDIGTVSVTCDEFRIVSYTDDIKPIINTKCAIAGGCHDGGNGENLKWTVLSNLQDHQSSLKDRITRAPIMDGHMPKKGSLTYDQIKLIYCWAEQGAQDN